ncbi:hypothetical protein [Streptomyces sp. NPDC046805]|uniref:hypothetical protein n=1 Tax=Streptomyces sp. NPDC046805 TaxID=3155134 RepID=UPI0033E4B1FC
MAHTVLGGVIGLAWLMLPGMTVSGGGSVPLPVPVPAKPGGAVAVAPVAPPEQDETSPVDFVLPLVVVGAAGALAAYGYVRRTRRARTRTTPGGGVVSERPPEPSPAESERQARAALITADDSVRTSREELGFAQEQLGTTAVAPFERALRAAETELSAAFALRLRYEQGAPADDVTRRQALVGMVGRCAEAGRRLDAEAGRFDQLRDLERGLGEASAAAEARFQNVAGRATDAETTLTELGEQYGSSAVAPVLGYVEQAKDRLRFASAELDRAGQTADSEAVVRAVRHLRAAEGAVAQADVFVSGVERLGRESSEAAALVPATLKDAEAGVAEARRRLTGPPQTDGPTAGKAARIPVGELRARVARADVVLGAVREEVAGGAYAPLDVLRRVARVVEALGVGRAGAVPVAARLVARSATGAAGDFVTTHRGAVGAGARTRLAEAERLLAGDEGEGTAAADELAREARELAERDVRAHGNPYAGPAEHASGLAGAVLGGILLAEEPDGGPPAGFGGPQTRGRLRLPEE